MAAHEPGALVRTKIVATLGPATTPAGVLETLLEGGVDVCRLNFSHGTHEQHLAALKRIRDWSAANDRPIGVLGDLCGPKIRLNAVVGGSFTLQTGQSIRIVRGEEDCTPQRLTITWPSLIDEVQVGHRIYIDDGSVRLLVVERNSEELRCTVTVGGPISSRKGVNLPDTRLQAPALTEKDRLDLDWAVANELDFVALSFVRRPSDLRELRTLLKQRGSSLHVIVKIEKVEALEHLDELIGIADGVMVARGDLGVEADVWQVPLIQKSITAHCRTVGKPVIVATQMLQTMVASPAPTRAEVSDVANAILDAADAVMLSAETAAGDFPAAAVEIMQRVAGATEVFLAVQNPPPQPTVVGANLTTSAIAQAAVEAARVLDARLLAVWTATGETARQIARHRLPLPVIGISYDPGVCRRLNLLYGVTPLLVEPLHDPKEMLAVLERRLRARGLAKSNDVIVIVTSTRPTTPGATDTLLVHRIPTVREGPSEPRP